MAQYRKKPVTIEAVRWRGYNSNLGITAEGPDQPVEITAVGTLEGEMMAAPGDWIILETRAAPTYWWERPGE